MDNEIKGQGRLVHLTNVLNFIDSGLLNMDHVEYLLSGAMIVTGDKVRTLINPGSIAIKNGLIFDIGPSSEIDFLYESDSKVDVTNKVVFPGLINTHSHLFQVLLRGLGEGLPLSEWAKKITTPVVKKLTIKDIYYASLTALLESVHCGTTTVVDFTYGWPDISLNHAGFKAGKDIGIRYIQAVGFSTQDRPVGKNIPLGFVEAPEQVADKVSELAHHYHDPAGLSEVWVGPSAVWTNSTNGLQMAGNLADTLKTRFTTHISETDFDRQISNELLGAVDIEILRQFDLLSPATLLVHCVQLTDDEIKMIGSSGSTVIYVPVSNMFLGSGIARIKEMLKYKIPVTMGTDGAASNNSQNMLETVKIGALLQRALYRDATLFLAADIFYRVTLGAAEAIGLSHRIGSLEKGKLADLFVYDPLLNAQSIPMHDPVSMLVFSGATDCITDVFVAGKPVLRESGTSIDEKAVLLETHGRALSLQKSK